MDQGWDKKFTALSSLPTRIVITQNRFIQSMIYRILHIYWPAYQFFKLSLPFQRNSETNDISFESSNKELLESWRKMGDVSSMGLPHIVTSCNENYANSHEYSPMHAFAIYDLLWSARCFEHLSEERSIMNNINRPHR